MGNECSFCTERYSTAIVRDDLVLAKLTARVDLYPYQSILLKKAFLFDKPAPKLNSPYLVTLLDEKAACSLYWSAIFFFKSL